MKTPLFFTGSSTSNVSTSADRYAPLGGVGPNVTSFGTISTGYVANASRMPCAGTISGLRARFPTALSQGTYTLTLMKGSAQNNLAATALTVTISTSSTDANDLVNEVTVAEGDYVAWKVTPSGTPTAQAKSVQIACLFESDTPGRSVMFSFIASGAAACSVAPGCGANNNGTEAAETVICPVAGTITKIYASLSNNAGAPGSGNTRTITLRKGTVGSLSNTTLTVTFGATDVNKTLDLGGSPIAVAAGDALSIAQAISGTPTSSVVSIAIEFIPTVSGQVPRMSTFPGALSTTITRYGVVTGRSLTAEADETNVAQLVPADLTVKSFRYDTATAPASGKSRTATLRKNGADTALVASIADANTTASDTEDVAFVGGDTISAKIVPLGTPTASSWGGLATVMVVDDAAPVVNFTDSDKAGQTFEGIRNTSEVVVGGAYSNTPTDVEIRLVDDTDTVVPGFDYVSADVQTGGAYSHTFVGVPVGGPYYQEVRDNGGTSTISTHDIYVGAVVVLWGQSQAQKLHTDDTSGLTPTSGSNVRVMTYSSQTNVSSGTPTITKLTNGMGALAKVTGSGIVAIANQWHADVGADVPLMIVTTAYQGTSIEFWINDRKGDYPANTDTTTLWGTTPTTGFAWHMAYHAKYQASAVLFMQGTSDVDSVANIGGGVSYADAMETLKGMFESLYDALTEPPLFIVVPHQRSDDGNNTFNMRAAQYAKAISGDNWRLGAWILDWQLFSNGDPHQAYGATGNIRGGTRIGRNLAKHLYDDALNSSGPLISSAAFTDGSRNVIKITYDRDITLADGTVYAGSPISLPIQFNISVNDGSTFTTIATPGHTSQLTGAREVTLTKTGGGAWVSGDTTVDYLRGTPYASDAATTNDYIGAESGLEASHLSKVITDTSSFDGNRGVPARPVMGTGFAVAEAGVVYTTIEAPDSGGVSVTLTKAQLSTLRVKAGSYTPGSYEPVALRWDREDGDTTGDPVDGINVNITVTS